jgi:hypothetical protein
MIFAGKVRNLPLCGYTPAGFRLDLDESACQRRTVDLSAVRKKKIIAWAVFLLKKLGRELTESLCKLGHFCVVEKVMNNNQTV